MSQAFLTALELMQNQISAPTFMLEHRTKSTYFRKSTGKMTFKEAVYFILKGLRKTMQIELDEWFFALNGDKCMMTKQGFSQLRKKISPGAFIDLNNEYISWYYKNLEYVTYKGYRLLAIDGSITEIPNSQENREEFGYYHNQSERQQARAQVSVIYDIENDQILESAILPWTRGEREVAKELIKKLSTKGFKNDLLLFDRGYPSKEMFDYLEEQGLKFVIRSKVNKFQANLDAANQEDQIINIVYQGKNLTLRVINVALSNGETEKLVTNIFDETFTPQDFKELYFKRWGIESKYSQLKGRYELENFSGVSPIAIMQDFYAAIYLSNLMSLAQEDANKQAAAKGESLKYRYKVNMNILIAKITKLLIICFNENDIGKRQYLLDQAMGQILKNLVPIRPDRHFPRKEPSRKNKYPLNRKRSL